MCCDAVVEVVDDVLVGDVGDGSPHVEEAFDVGPQGLAGLLFAHCKSVASSYPMQGSLEVVDENFLEVIPGVDGLRL